MNDYGEIVLKKINNSSDFWCLIDELCDDNSGFLCNRTTILDAYNEGNLYGLKIIETDEMFKRGARKDIIFCDNSFYLLPTFCIIDKYIDPLIHLDLTNYSNKIVIIWTHTRARKMGFAKKLIELLKIEYAFKPLPESIKFWEKCNIKLIL